MAIRSGDVEATTGPCFPLLLLPLPLSFGGRHFFHLPVVRRRMEGVRQKKGEWEGPTPHTMSRLRRGGLNILLHSSPHRGGKKKLQKRRRIVLLPILIVPSAAVAPRRFPQGRKRGRVQSRRRRWMRLPARLDSHPYGIRTRGWGAMGTTRKRDTWAGTTGTARPSRRKAAVVIRAMPLVSTRFFRTNPNTKKKRRRLRETRWPRPPTVPRLLPIPHPTTKKRSEAAPCLRRLWRREE